MWKGCACIVNMGVCIVSMCVGQVLVLDWPHRLHLTLWKHDLQAAALWTSTPLVSCCAEHDPPLPVPSTGPGHPHQLRPLTSLISPGCTWPLSPVQVMHTGRGAWPLSPVQVMHTGCGAWPLTSPGHAHRHGCWPLCASCGELEVLWLYTSVLFSMWAVITVITGFFLLLLGVRSSESGTKNWLKLYSWEEKLLISWRIVCSLFWILCVVWWQYGMVW